jgi:hypothetical protein
LSLERCNTEMVSFETSARNKLHIIWGAVGSLKVQQCYRTVESQWTDAYKLHVNITHTRFTEPLSTELPIHALKSAYCK